MANKSDKLPWIKFYLYDWLHGTSGMTFEQKAIYLTLILYMYDKKAPLKDDFGTLSRVCNCSQKKFATVVEYLIKRGKLIQKDDGLWNSRVEEELKDLCEKNDEISKARSEAGKKGAQAKINKKQYVNDFAAANGKQNDDFAEANDKQNDFFAEANGKQNQANQNQNQIINKKTNTIVLAKKEIDDGLDQNTDQVLELVSEQSEVSSETPPPIHEQKDVLKKTKQSKANRGCRLPSDFEPDYDFAIQEGLPPERVKVEIAKFRDYWSSKSGANATKIDWQATWRNWVRNAKDFNKPSQGVNYGKQGNEPIHWSRRVVHEMSNLKNADSLYSFLFKDDERISTPLAPQSETLTFRSGEDYISSQ